MTKTEKLSLALKAASVIPLSFFILLFGDVLYRNTAYCTKLWCNKSKTEFREWRMTVSDIVKALRKKFNESPR